MNLGTASFGACRVSVASVAGVGTWRRLLGDGRAGRSAVGFGCCSDVPEMAVSGDTLEPHQGLSLRVKST